jgi:hypothetical protein
MTHLEPDRPTPKHTVTMEMIQDGVEAYLAFDPDKEDPDALVAEILYRAMEKL